MAAPEFLFVHPLFPSSRHSAYHRGELAADFYPTVKAALRHESADSEEDRKGLGCHLGQGLCILVHKLRSDCQPKSDFVHIRIE